VAGVMAGITALQVQIDQTENAGLALLGEKIDALVALANSAGAPAAA